MITNVIFVLSCLLLNVMGTDDAVDLQGKTCQISGGDVSMFDGREVRNGTLVIAEGSYRLQVKKEGGTCLRIGDNMEVVIDGRLQLAPNGFKSYDVIRIVGSNVKIHGKGSITGDRLTHTGREGEWGMGIRFGGARHVAVSGLAIANCWGDCIYIGGGSKDIRISNCQLRGSRRQGISITKAENVIISHCRIADISGTNPQYAIDIEPNKRCVVDDVLIEHVTVTGCEGGFRAVLGKSTYGNARIGKVEIRQCHVSAKSRKTIQFAGCEQAMVNDCVIETRKGEKPILMRRVGSLLENNNKVIYTKTR
jgi:hypothetical protein